MGTPDFAVPTLRKIAARHQVVAVYTRAPKPAGRRGLELTPSAVEREARHLDLQVFTPATLRDPTAVETFKAHGADAAVVVAYGLILPEPILDVLPGKFFNLHASLLPDWRGAAPINRAIMEGDEEIGVTVMQMEPTLDTGPIVEINEVSLIERVRVGPDATAGELHDVLADLGADLMVRALDGLEHGALRTRRQPEAGSYARKLNRDATRINWDLPWRQVHNQVRGLSPIPGAWFELPIDGKPVAVKVLRTIQGEGSGEPGTVLDNHLTIACGEGAIRILRLQRQDRQAMAAEDFLRGLPLRPGTRLG
jgi:methionyl-tRNA formyltransferase